MSIPAARIKQLRAILLKGRYQMQKNIFKLHPYTPRERVQFGKDNIASWVAARPNMARVVKWKKEHPNTELLPYQFRGSRTGRGVYFGIGEHNRRKYSAEAPNESLKQSIYADKWVERRNRRKMHIAWRKQNER